MSWLRSSSNPTRRLTCVGFSSDTENTGDPHSGQNACVRLAPLSATLT